MLKKLLKQDLLQTRKLYFPFLIVLAVATALICGCITVLNYVPTLDNEIIQTVLTISATILLAFSSVAIIIYAVAGSFVSYIRYYKNFFTDEGYLTFTLPASEKQLYLSKFLNALIYQIFVAFTTIVSVILILFTILNTTANTPFLYESAKEFILTTLQARQIIFGGFTLLIQAVWTITSILLAITLGCVLSNKRPILSSIGFYYLIQTVTSIVSSAIQLTLLRFDRQLGIYDPTNLNYLAFDINISNIAVLTLLIIFCIASYFITQNLLKKKLNII